jgi:hypothetical protein
VLKKVRRDYLEFRLTYRPLLRAAKREMDTTLQKNLLDTVAAMAFSSGYRAGAKNSPPVPSVKLRPWKGNKK